VSHIVPLHLLAAGESGSICEIGGNAHLVRRLDEMGLRSGAAVRMVQPGHPCIVALDHQRLSFRGDDEAIVLVEVFRP
jgi:Fe2+ transport system protein FeoA